ncbi:glycosyl transferase [Polaribacter sp. ALD11]|uniref:glycosyltransferase family 2 protein n=1 Tax=Polaribacter sp. ALD11 TaxID=2058137 RepID=UPI000C302A9E|nr:glycosyltransferase [Polaribacter sp. ALD11]AUC86423.1 glycosyl transferase [Polaribacter sp. ALD11]
MISVLIPTYKYNCFPFVQELHNQLTEAAIRFQIICLDDGSKPDFNIENNGINKLSNSHFRSLDKNIGRSAIRNLLIKESFFDWLLFLDADGFPKNDNFIQLYVDYIHSKTDFVGFIGGRIHKKEESKNLRVKFGTDREELSVVLRNKNPYRFLFTSNILLKKSVFNKIKFNEDLKGYGYEDVLLGNSIRDKDYKILHINNPVYHLQIENNTVFINKTKQGLTNLFFLENEKLITENDIKLLKYFHKIEDLKLDGFFKNKVNFFIKMAVKTSNLVFYDLFKLSYLCYLKEVKKYGED